jgi:hypothetical protein
VKRTVEADKVIELFMSQAEKSGSIWQNPWRRRASEAASLPSWWFSGVDSTEMRDLSSKGASGMTAMKPGGRSDVYFDPLVMQDSTLGHEFLHAGDNWLSWIPEHGAKIKGFMAPEKREAYEARTARLAKMLEDGTFYRVAGGESGVTDFMVQSLMEVLGR